MYNSIQLTDPYAKNTKILESFSTDPLMEAATSEQLDLKLYTEAVFSGGKEKLQPIVDRVTKIKEYLESCIQEQDRSVGEVNDWAKKKANERGLNLKSQTSIRRHFGEVPYSKIWKTRSERSLDSVTWRFIRTSRSIVLRLRISRVKNLTA